MEEDHAGCPGRKINRILQKGVFTMNEAEIILTANRHKEMAKAETQLEMVKAFFQKSLDSWHPISYSDLEVLCAMLGIERREEA
jgi:hypothetical protein